MKARIEALIAALRREGVAVSIAEAMDAARAVAVVGVERSALRDALAATLVKDEHDRAVFVAAFDAVFPARSGDVAEARGARRRRRGGEEGGAGGGAGGGSADGGAPRRDGSDAHEGAADGRAARPASDPARRGERAARPPLSHAGDERHAAGDEAAHEGRQPPDAERRATASGERRSAHAADEPRGDADDAAVGAATRARLARERALLRLPFRAMTPVEVEASAELARAIAARCTTRVRRRLRPRVTGRLDFRRTIRAAVPRGGVPFDRRWRSRRPGAPDLVALCDLSASTATATDFFLATLAPASAHFRRVTLFGFVDRLVEIEFVDGQVRPAAPIDLMARSDFGRVLRDLVENEASVLGADTVLLVLGDARNNRRPPRADLLAAARARVRRVLWLNPDPRERWDTGDSVIAAYARHVDAVVACGSLAELDRALGAVAAL